MKYLPITKEEALAAARSAAFTIAQDGWDMDMKPTPADAGRTILHCFMGGFGADWDLESVQDAIERSTAVGWVDHMLGHDLVVQTDGKLRFFDVKHPTAVER